MRVTLLSYTTDPAEIVYTAARTCYSSRSPEKIYEGCDSFRMGETLSHIHGSVFEHANFTFSIEGVSRVTTHQLVRHRIASFSQQSMRYVDVHRLWDHIVIPPKVQDVLNDEDELADSRKDEHMLNAIENYKHALSQLMSELDKHRIPSEDIRYFVPNGVQANMVVTMNARELQHFCGLRRCKRAQWEIRELADKMAKLVQEECPELCAHLDLGPQCDQLGYCPEHQGCGRVKIIRDPEHKYFGKFQKEGN